MAKAKNALIQVVKPVTGRSSVLLVMVLLLAGCNRTQQDFAAFHELMKGSPAYKTQWIARCSELYRDKYSTADQMRKFAGRVGSSIAAAPHTACMRMANGVASGRMTYADDRSVSRGEPSKNFKEILYGN